MKLSRSMGDMGRTNDMMGVSSGSDFNFVASQIKYVRLTRTTAFHFTCAGKNQRQLEVTAARASNRLM